uniref:Uncharacterized protein n=1 Tax=Rousettus aegyptiacus TaxID=9407 RepID=A0A7J8BRZ8_ROUAE|nr:hypothetical protein HJG63_009538 [Rousettus aegyptiacus]
MKYLVCVIIFTSLLVDPWSLEVTSCYYGILFSVMVFPFTKYSNSRSLKMSNPRKCSIPMRDVNLVLQQSLAKDSFDEANLYIHFCSEITPRTVFIFYFHFENQSDLLQPQRTCLCKIKLMLAVSCTFFFFFFFS